MFESPLNAQVAPLDFAWHVDSPPWLHAARHLAASLEALRHETANVAESHAAAADQVKGALLPALMAFRARIAFFRATSLEAIEKTQKIKASQAIMVERGRHKYNSERVHAETYAAQLAALTGSSREKDRVRSKLDQSQKDTKIAEVNYRLYTKALGYTSQAWAVQWRAFLDQAQDMDEDRIEFLSRTSCWCFVDAMADACVADDRSYQAIYDALKVVSPTHESATFVHNHGTGNMILDPPSADDLTGTSQASLSVENLAYPCRPGFRVARFPRTSNRVDLALASSPAPTTEDPAPSKTPALVAPLATTKALSSTTQAAGATQHGSNSILPCEKNDDLVRPTAGMAKASQPITTTATYDGMTACRASISSAPSSTVLPWLAGTDSPDSSSTPTGSRAATPSPPEAVLQSSSTYSHRNSSTQHFPAAPDRHSHPTSPEPPPQDPDRAHTWPMPSPQSTVHPSEAALPHVCVQMTGSEAARHCSATAPLLVRAKSSVIPTEKAASSSASARHGPLLSHPLTAPSLTPIQSEAQLPSPLLTEETGRSLEPTLIAVPPPPAPTPALVPRTHAPKDVVGGGSSLAKITRHGGSSSPPSPSNLAEDEAAVSTKSGRGSAPTTQAATATATGKVTDRGEAVQFFVIAMYDYEARTPQQFSFTRGDIIGVTATAASGWWSGELLDESRRAAFGSTATSFPSNYCALLS